MHDDGKKTKDFDDLEARDANLDSAVSKLDREEIRALISNLADEMLPTVAAAVTKEMSENWLNAFTKKAAKMVEKKMVPKLLSYFYGYPERDSEEVVKDFVFMRGFRTMWNGVKMALGTAFVLALMFMVLNNSGIIKSVFGVSLGG